MSYDFENKTINRNIKTSNLFKIDKMEDYYLAVRFTYRGYIWNGAVPIKAKYQGVDIPLTKDDVFEWTQSCYEALDPGNYRVWQTNQIEFWDSINAEDTHLVFDALNGTEPTTKWLCRKCGPVPKVNPQAGARIKKLKEYGYHIATVKMECSVCGKKQFFDLLIRLPRHPADNQRRFSISAALRNKILNTLPLKDSCFETTLRPNEAIIDHKFPSSRWVNGETINETDMPIEDIKKKFQILTNQTNLQKERYCQRCVTDGIRGNFFGIEWYYQGDSNWSGTSKADENGCVGCPWYDLHKWKDEFNKHLKNNLM